jgi:hypothetical protein
MWNARSLAEFNQSSWIQIDFAPLINHQRKEEHRHVTKRIEDIFDQGMSGESIQKIFEGEREEDDEGWLDRFKNSKIYDEGEGENNHDEPKSSLFTTPCTPIEEADFELIGHGHSITDGNLLLGR